MQKAVDSGLEPAQLAGAPDDAAGLQALAETGRSCGDLRQHVLQDFNARRDRLEARLTDALLPYGIRLQVPTVDLAVHPLCKPLDKFVGFLRPIFLQILFLGFIKPQGHPQHQQSPCHAAAAPAIPHPAAKAGAEFKGGWKIQPEILCKRPQNRLGAVILLVQKHYRLFLMSHMLPLFHTLSAQSISIKIELFYQILVGL